MKERAPTACRVELQPLLELTHRVGSDPLLTQASTGNTSAKVNGILWIKASGTWMAEAKRNEILIPLDLAKVVTECLRQGVDPAVRYPGASLETALHAALPHRVVVHLHCVNTIAWAVRTDASNQLKQRLEGLRWQWIPYANSGLPLARKIEETFAVWPETNVFVLGNHGLVVAGDDAVSVEALLTEIRRRLAIPPRRCHSADYAALKDISRDSPWNLPDDDGMHALGTDLTARSILEGGFLYPCQAIFSNSTTAEIFRPVPYADARSSWKDQYHSRPFLIIEGCGIVIGRRMGPAALAMMSGLAQVVQRIDATAPLRYLTEVEVADISSEAADRYRDLAIRVQILTSSSSLPSWLYRLAYP